MSRKTAREVAMKLAFASLFGGERSPAYINGMLGTLAKRLEGGEAS